MIRKSLFAIAASLMTLSAMGGTLGILAGQQSTSTALVA